MTSLEQTLANIRFGYGGLQTFRGSGKQYLQDQLVAFDSRLAVSGLPSTQEIIPKLAEYRSAARDDTDARDAARKAMRAVLRDAATARLNHAIATPTPFAERLVHFWANHFAVSSEKLGVGPLAGAYEAEAIRPHLMGRFSDMLMAVESHPAMLLYLDQAQSIGPNSRRGTRIALGGRRQAGINENLAREIMELHTMGVRSGYSQADVREFAYALTGWSIGGLRGGPQGAEHGFVFNEATHEPGVRTILSKSYRANGVKQVRTILADLAAHPSTARHIATKLARHFVADDPPAELVTRLEGRFLESGGNLPDLYRELINAPEAWNMEQVKFTTPFDWTVASLRTLQLDNAPARNIEGLLRNLGQELWKPGAPAGFEDRATRWAAPDALYRRVEAADRLARFTGAIDARALAPQIYGELLTETTSTALRRAESPDEAMALLLVSPEAMWR